jgi:galactose mutarotase-like enzyme
MDLPVRRALLHDSSMIPTGESTRTEPGRRRLGDSEWDDGFADLATPPRFVLSNDGSEVALTFLRGYRFAQVFAPPGSDFVCFEPMTAPTNALSSGVDLPVVAPGGRYETAFAISARLGSSRSGDAQDVAPADTYEA